MNAFLIYSYITHSYGGKPGNNKAFGSGIFLLFTDIVDVLPFNPLKDYVHQTVFATSHEYTQAVLCPEPKHKMKHIPITDASAAAWSNCLLYSEKNLQSRFIYNYGVSAGAVLVKYFNSITQSQTVISHTILKNNFNIKVCPGSYIKFFFYINDKKQQYNKNDKLFPLTIFNCSFTPDHLPKDSSYGVICAILIIH